MFDSGRDCEVMHTPDETPLEISDVVDTLAADMPAWATPMVEMMADDDEVRAYLSAVVRDVLVACGVEVTVK